MFTSPFGAGVVGRDEYAATSPFAAPPWLSFSGRWPWVRWPPCATSVVNGLGPSVPSAAHTTMVPMDSYHDARAESYVVEMRSTSPGCTDARQSGSVAVIATSHDTAPAGS